MELFISIDFQPKKNQKKKKMSLNNLCYIQFVTQLIRGNIFIHLHL